MAETDDLKAMGARLPGAHRSTLAAALVAALLWAVVLVGLATAAALSPGQRATAESAPWWTAVAVAVWSGVALSLVLTVLGLARRSAGLLVVAAALSALLTVSTFGVLVWPVSIAQLGVAVAILGAHRPPTGSRLTSRGQQPPP